MFTKDRPGRLPANYRFLTRVDGRVAGGFPTEPRQSAFVHVTGASRQERHNPLIVHVTDNRRWDLTGTEGRGGARVDLGVPGVDTVYHDGV